MKNMTKVRGKPRKPFLGESKGRSKKAASGTARRQRREACAHAATRNALASASPAPTPASTPIRDVLAGVAARCEASRRDYLADAGVKLVREPGRAPNLGPSPVSVRDALVRAGLLTPASRS